MGNNDIRKMSIKNKIYEDYIKKSRLPEYKILLKEAKKNGYVMMGILDFYNYILNNKGIERNTRILLNRHDIDTSPNIAKKMFLIEQDVYGTEGSSTAYFRESTIDISLIKQIEMNGYETGYHYEQLATYEKKHKCKSSDVLNERIFEIREIFSKDYIDYKNRTGTNSFSVASHGDFVNTKLDMQSYSILEDVNLRKKLGIVVEAYDKAIMDYVNERFADQLLLDNFCKKVMDAINRKTHVIMILTHPRNWEVDIFSNTKENFVRLFQGIKYKL